MLTWINVGNLFVRIITEVYVLYVCRDWVLLDQVREEDALLLRTLSVRLICDLMVEMRKTKLGLP